MYNTSASWKEQIYTNKQCIMNVYFDNVLINSDYILDFKKGGEIFDEEFSLEIATSQYIELKILKDQIATMPEVIRVEFGILLNNNSNTTEIIPIGIYNLESYTDNDDGTLTIKALDNMIKFEFNYDGSTLVNTNGSATLLQVVQDICNQAGVELGSTSFLNSDKQIAVYDNSVSAREYIKYIAESSGGFACIGRDGKLYFKDIYQDTAQISIDMFGTYKWSEEFKISKVHYEDGVRNFTFGDSTRNTLYINQDNMFIVSQAQVQNIFNKVKNLTINSFEGQTIIDPAIDLGDKIIIDGKPVVFQGEIALAGSFIADIKCNIQTKQKEETTVITPSQVAINRRVQGQIDQVEGRITQLVEETSENTQNISLHEQTINGITNTVSSVQTKLNNMQIGGTNLLRGTNTVTALTSPGTWSRGTWRQAGTGTGTRTSIEASDSPNANIKVGWRTSSSSAQVLISQDNVPSTVGEVYTISCYAKGTGKIKLQYGNDSVGYLGVDRTIEDENNWKKYVYTFISRGTANIYFGSDAQGYDVSFCGMKLEKGNMATDWSPAPEDIDSNLENNYYTKTQTESKIDQKADEIISTVTTIETKVNNLQIGGRNLALNTRKFFNAGKSGTIGNGLEGTPELLEDTSTPSGYCAKYQYKQSSGNTGIYLMKGLILGTNAQKMKADGIYTLSFYAKASTSTSFSSTGIFAEGQTIITPANLNLTTEWKRFYTTFRWTNTTKLTTCFYIPQGDVILYLSSFKLEEGNLPTDWTPAPEDIESNLESNYYTKIETESKIDQRADSITSTVSQNYSTKAETTQAKNEAINSANTATDNKLENYSTTTQMNSAITQKANEITSTVTTLENKVNNMQVGGRNLLLNSKTLSGKTGTNIDNDGFSEGYTTGNGTWNEKQYWWSVNATDNPLTGKQVCISLDFKTDDITKINKMAFSIGTYASNKTTRRGDHNLYVTSYKTIDGSDLENNKWTRIYCVATIPSSFTHSDARYYALQTKIAYDAGTPTMYYKKIKIELGNKPTDWSPAPEDIENDLDTNYYTKTETETKINQKADEISSTVSSVSTQLNNLQVGGTNLLRGTNIITALTNQGTWANGTWRSAGGGTGTRTSISVSDAPNANIKVGWSTTSTSGQVLIAQDNVKTTSGEIYTLSCYAKGTRSILLQYGNGTVGYTGSNIQITDENNWKKYSYTFTSRGTANIYIGSNAAGNNVSFCGMKLEKGNMATDWSPAPEDIAANYYTKTETNSQITQKANEINIEVAKKVGNDEIISKINQSAEQIEIGANKINILGKKVKFTTNIEGNYTFSQSDLDKIVAYIMGEGTLTSSEKELYDINKDGMVRATDYMKIKNAVNNNNGVITLTGTFEIDPDSAKRSLILRDSSGNIITSVGLLGMQTQSLGAERIESIDATFQNLTVEGTFTNNSDKRLKTDIVELDNKYTNLIKDIDPVVFTYKKSNQRHIGFIAQDVEQAFNKENIESTLIKKDDLGIYSLDYIQLIGILWKDNKSKNELIEDLKSRIEKLEKEVNK